MEPVDLVGEGREGRVVGRREHETALAGKSLKELREGVAPRGVEVEGGLIKQDDGGVVRESRGERDALPLPAAEGERVAVEEGREAEALEEGGVRGGQPQQARRQGHLFSARWAR